MARLGNQQSHNKFSSFLRSVQAIQCQRDILLARAMITQYGMSDDFSMVAMETITGEALIVTVSSLVRLG